MNYTLCIELPGLPKSLNGSHGHWATRHAHAKRWHKAVALAVGSKLPPTPLRAAIVTLTRLSTRPMDGDNLAASFKHPLDGLVRCGVLSDDSFKVIGMPTYAWERSRFREGRIRIEVREREE